MVSDWITTTLGEFTTLQRGHDLPSATRIHGNIPILGSFGITGWHNESKVSGPGVTVGRSGASYGVVSYSEVDYWPLNTALFVKNFHGNHPKFAYYLLKSMDFERYNSGSAVQSLNRNHIHPIEIKIPPFLEQKAIAHILGSLDDKIELNCQMNETIEAMAQALFKSWFVDFDPVIDNALAAGNIIPDELFERAEQRKKIEKKDNSDIQGLFPDGFEFTEEMGWIPRGWDTREVQDFGQVVCGKTPSKQKAEYYGNDISFIKIPDMHNVAWATTTTDNLSFEGSNSQKNKLIPKGSICVSCIATVGKVLMTSREAHTNQQINSLIPAEKNTLYYLYSSFLGMEKNLKDLASGGAVTLNLNTSNFSKIKLILPLTPVLDAYDSSVNSLYEKNLKSLIQNQELAKLRDTLLPKLMSGVLRIAEAAALVDEAL